MEETTERFSVELARKKGLATLGVALVVATMHSALSYLITIAFGYAEMGVLPAVAPAVVFGAYALNAHRCYRVGDPTLSPGGRDGARGVV